jgi:hypothetical protein
VRRQAAEHFADQVSDKWKVVAYQFLNRSAGDRSDSDWRTHGDLFAGDVGFGRRQRCG